MKSTCSLGAITILGSLLLFFTNPAVAALGQLLQGHVPVAVRSLQPTGRFAGTNHLNLAIALPLRNPAALSNLLHDLYDPASPQYHHYLTPGQFAEQFGPAKQDYQAVVAFANANGLRVTATHPNRVLVDVEGSAADVERALHVTLHTYRHPTENRAFYSPDTEPTLDLAVPILHISGLNNYSLPRPRLMINPQVNGWGAAPNSGSGPSGGYMGRDFRAAYVPDTALNGTGQTVGLLQFDGYTASDITYYENLAGLPNVPLQNVLVDGASGLPSGGGGEVEVSLDIEMAISMATNLSKVMVYEAPNPSPFVDLLSRMANDNLAKQLSCSWYVPNGVAEPAADVIFQQLAAQGQSFFSASGDYDAFTGLIPFPGDTPYITEVGGTTLTTTGPGGSYTSETVWNRGNGIGSGGGISTQYPIPNWQTNVSMAGNQGSTTMRNVPDVALTAENVYVRADGSDQNVGGTSCAAPLWAGFMALVNQQAAATGKPPIGFVNPAIYTIGAAANYTSVFHDTTTGNNTSSSSPTKFYAMAGYDLCTGWGTPAGQKLIDALAPPIIVRLPLSATEGDGLLAGAGHIQLPSAQAMDVTVSLNSSDPSQVTVPATVTILAGNTNASFNLTILDDGVLDGTQIATITASVPGLGSGSGSMTIYDKETATLQVALPATVTKGQGAVPGAMQVSAPVGANVTVALTSDTTNLIQVPALVVIPTGQTSAVFTATILTDGQINGGQTVHVTAHVQNWTDGVAAVAVRDNVNLTVALPGSAWENAGVLTNAGSVSLAGTSATAIVISLASGNPSKLIVPSSVTISAGSLSNTFNVTPVDDPLVEGHQLIAVTASATGFTNGSAAMWVLDKETPPFPFNPRPGNLAANVPANTNLTWSSSSNTTELILNGGFETGSLANWTQVPNSLYDGKFYTNNGTLKPYSPDPALPPYAGGYSALGDEYGPGIFYMYQTVSIPANATSATLSWAHRVRNFYSSFSTSQQFQVRICDTANNILATPFTTSPGDPLLGDWVQKSYDMTAFAGQTVRVMFWVNSQLYYIDAHVDNVSVQANVPTANPLGVITNDVYFGVNPTPGPAEFQGSTTNTSWALPLLAPLTTYYWQIIAHRVGSATGAVWQFTTAGVDHFAWNTISTPQLVNQPFSATITAKDAFNTTVSNFTGPVALNGTSGGGQITNSILGSPIHTFSGSVNSFTDGTAFTPNTNLTVTHVRHYFGNKVSIWTDGGVLLAAQNVTSVPGTWVETPLATPIQLMAGIRYRVGIYRTGVVNYWRTDMAGVFPNGTIDQSYEVSGDAFPTTSDSARWWFVDLRYTVGTSVAVTVTPTNSGNFVNGSWTGNMTVQQPATNVILLANDGNQHTGSSNPFDVVLTNDLSINIVDSPHPVSVGASLTYTLTVANTGPADSTGVMVTNLLTAGATFVSATSSQGTCGQNGGVVTCNLGVVHGGTNATVTIVVVPTAAGMNLTNVATVSRNEAESYLGNNTATTITPVTPPAISIADASVIEGNVGTTNMIFAVTLAVPGAQTITVNYATSDGTATTGSDYVATNGVLTFPPGATNGTISVAVIGNIFVESNKTLFVTLSNPVNGVLVRAQATGTIINDDGLPGDVYSIVWSAIPSPQLAGQPFGVTITALDYSNNVATNFNGTVALSAGTVAINPANSGNFTNGVWSGSVTVPQHETNVVVRADDGNGHVGLSNPFVVALTNTAPVILVQPTNQIVMVSSNVTVSVTADGTPPLAYQWNFGGTNIMDATNAILTLANVQLTNAGNYAVVITNIYGLVTSSNAVLTVLVAPPCDPAPSGLVAWWQGEGNANDSIGANNGSINGGVAYTNGELGQAFSLDGTSGFVSVPAGSSLDVGLSNGFTIEGWVNPTTTATQRPILEWTTGGNIGVHFWISADNYGGLKVGSLYANLVDTGGGYHSFSSGAGLLFTNQFQHVALTYDKSSGTGRLYLNGLVVTQQNLGVFTPETSLNLNLGTRPGTTYFWSGLLDEISLYSRALSSNEIAGIYNSGSGGKCPVPPIILSQPTNQTVSVGGTATFSVSANGIPPFFYQWNFNGTNIVGATNTSLTLTNVQLNQAGYYAVLVANAGGSTISSNALLTVNPATTNIPVITAFTPQSGAMGAVVNISGLNFDPAPGNNTVYFGAVQAVVSAASATNLTVTVPTGATYRPITETVNGLTAYSPTPFLPTFLSAGVLTNSSFGTQVNLGLTNGPGQVIIADLDGDGKPDLVIISGANTALISIYRNISTNGTLTAGSFAPRVDLSAGNLGGSSSIAAADVDGDGRLDLMVANSGINAVSVFKNQCVPGSITTNSFGTRVDFPVGASPSGVAVQDLDGDGRPDIVTANYGDNTISVLRNIGTAGVIATNSFAPAVGCVGGAGSFGVAIADLDGDGKPDVVTVNLINSNNGGVSVFRNVSTQGSIAFASRMDFPGPIYCYNLAIGDMDGDGKPDLVFISFANGQSVSVYRNASTPGSITLAPRIDFGLGAWGNGVAVGDLDGDGKPDVAAVTQSSSKLSLFRNISTPGGFTSGSLAARLDFASGSNPYGVAVGDLDGDGRPDIAFANNSSGTLSIYQNVIGIRPFIVLQPASQTNLVGTTATFNVVASGSTPLTYQWKFNGTNIVGATGTNFTILNVQATNAGIYSVAVTNTYGSIISSNATLTVLAPPAITLQPAGRTNLAGTTATFTNVTTGTLPLNYQWRKNGANLNDGGNVSGSATTNLSLSNVQDSDAAYYAMVVTNIAGSITSSPALLVVLDPPVILVQPTNLMVLRSSNATFGVTAGGSSPLVYQWNVNGTNLFAATNASLTLTNVQLNQAGNYAVLVTNTAGSILSSNAVLVVNPLFRFVWNAVPSPRFAGTPFAVTVHAQNSTNGPATNFTDTVILLSTNGLPVSPAVSGNFIQGVWTGAVMVAQTVTNLVLQASDSFGETGLANPINVVSLPALVTTSSGGTLYVIWPVNPSGFVLETTTGLSPAVWVPVSTQPFQFGGQNFQPIQMTDTNAFYRLRLTGQ